MLTCSSCGSLPKSSRGCTLCASWRYADNPGLARFFGGEPEKQEESGDLVIKREGRTVVDDGVFPYASRGDWTCPLCGMKGLTMGEVGLHIVTHAHESRYREWYTTTSAPPRSVPVAPAPDSPFRDLPLLRLIQ